MLNLCWRSFSFFRKKCISSSQISNKSPFQSKLQLFQVKCEVWWAKWKLFHFEIYAFWTISTVSKQVRRGQAWSHFKWNTHSHADISDKALWSASNQTDYKYFERITSSEFILSTQVCFKHHSAKCFYVAMFKAHCKNSNCANILNPNITILDHANFDLRATSSVHVQREFVTVSCNYSAQVAKV